MGGIGSSRRLRIAGMVCAWCLAALLGTGESRSPAAAKPPVTGRQPWTRQALGESAPVLRFAVLCDRSGGTRPGIFERAVERIRLLQPDLVLSIGDLIDGAAASPAELQAQWEELDGIVSRLPARFFYVPGNHDVSKTPFSTETWQKRYGPLYYHFVFRGALFLCLNSDDGQPGQIGEPQLRYVQNALREQAKPRWTFVFVHKPLWDIPDTKGWDTVEKLLDGRPYTVFSGHTHEYRHSKRKGRDYFGLSTTGAGWSKERKPGEFDQIGWVSLSTGEPGVAILKLDGLLAPADLP